MTIVAKLFLELTKTPFERFLLIVNLVIGFCVVLILTAILINFCEARAKQVVRYQRNSIVETGTMLLFFLGFNFILKTKISVIAIEWVPLRVSLIILGLAIIILGCITNIKGRLALGSNWANQIRIYNDHTIIKAGVYGLVRHPLYASLIWMFYGASIVYLNITAFCFNSFCFIPFMYYRAKQEERLLVEHFEDYQDYLNNTGMFFPRLRRRSVRR